VERERDYARQQDANRLLAGRTRLCATITERPNDLMSRRKFVDAQVDAVCRQLKVVR
jgi:hypothetical protein